MSEPILWPKFYLKAALDYLTARNHKPALVVDNSMLQDGVLATREKVSGDDCVICLAPQYIANLELDDYGVHFSARFNGFYHHLVIPYECINAVYAYQTSAIIEDNGEMNMFVIPKVVYPPGAVKRNEASAAKDLLNETAALNLEDQPAGDLENSHAPIAASFKR
jgi:stringent starvation protein B